MRTVVTEVIHGAEPAWLFAQVESLDRYPPWMRLVHRATELEPDEGRAAWWVELRARVGPFTRSKQLRMVRTQFEPGRRARFERIQPDERDHAAWILDATIEGADSGASMTMALEYSGQLWSRTVLGRILDDEIRRATRALNELLAGDSGLGVSPPPPESDPAPPPVSGEATTH
ncbi:SRPBCC family protein [Desertimonas flava]|uniref:SRPBCC family protein n=1 Tax=Desertimonas flava TaxID=2064846 RepID=UPI000E342FEA|nr:SRPBCC family protein [Desertimonas flava]